jgi:hypothetical protein
MSLSVNHELMVIGKTSGPNFGAGELAGLRPVVCSHAEV